jgi:phage terminase large subunit-like protein
MSFLQASPHMQNQIITEYAFWRLFASWGQEEKQAHIEKLSPLAGWRLKYTWRAWARDSQLPPEGDWSTWCIISGRGWGKTRTGAEWVIEKAWMYPGGHIALVGRTVADVRDVMIKGISGILAVSPPWFMPKYEPSKRLLTWPNSSYATTYSADEPDQLRGPNHSFAWGDERAAWQYDDAYDQLSFGLRIEPAPGVNPQALITTTPRNTKAMKELVSDPSTVVTRRSMHENRENLSPRFIREIERRYGGTRLGLQEIEGHIIDDIDGALWKRKWIDDGRVIKYPDLKRIVVAVDPPASSPETSNNPAECGIVVVGLGIDDHGYVLADCSLVGTPDEWAGEVLAAYTKFCADLIVGEVNNGGEMVGHTIKTAAKMAGMGNVPYEAIRASRGKQIRAEPVSTLYKNQHVHHVGVHPDLEFQLCNWVLGEKSPDRLDSAVWGVTKLMLPEGVGGGVLLITEEATALPPTTWEEYAGQVDYY